MGIFLQYVAAPVEFRRAIARRGRAAAGAAFQEDTTGHAAARGPRRDMANPSMLRQLPKTRRIHRAPRLRPIRGNSARPSHRVSAAPSRFARGRLRRGAPFPHRIRRGESIHDRPSQRFQAREATSPNRSPPPRRREGILKCPIPTGTPPIMIPTAGRPSTRTRCWMR